MSEKVTGYCPMGCGPTLFLGAGGYVTCSRDVCPHPVAASEILGDAEVHHIVKLNQATFTVRHPLREWLSGELMHCSLYDWLKGLSGPPAQRGTYRVLTPTGEPYSQRSGPDRRAYWASAVWERV